MKRALFLAAAICTGGMAELRSQTPGTLKWSFPMTNATTASPAVAADGTIYIADGGSLASPWRLWAVNPNGTAKWHYDLSAGAAGSPAVATNGTVYLFDVSGQISAVKPDGTNKWSLQDSSGGSGWGHPAVAPDGSVYFAYANILLALGPGGSVQWFFVDPDFPLTNYFNNFLFDYASPAIALDGTIYANGNNGRLYALNTNGTLKWVLPTPEADASIPMQVSPPAMAADGTIYCGVEKGATNAYFLAVRPNGTIKWAYADSSVGAFGSGAAIGPDGTIYVESTGGGAQGALYAFNQSGSNKWTYPVPAGLPADVVSSPAVAADGTVYIGGHDGVLYAINPDGTLHWATSALATHLHSSPSVAPDGTVYVAADGSPASLFAIYGSAPLACSFWPQYGKNTRHTGGTAPISLKPRGFDATNQFQFAITGATGIVCNVCGSTDLVTWTNVGTINLTAATNVFADSQTTNFARRFYRTTEQ